MRPLTEQVAVGGGSLTVHRLTQAPEGAPVVVALHSISSNALAWVPVADHLEGRVHVLAPDMRGRAITLGGEGASDLQNFNERASSLVVERGYWIFCSEPQYRGECRTFGPGEYPYLPRELDNRISSGRRISHDNDYRSQSSPR